MPKLTRQAETDHEVAEALLALPRELTRDEKAEVFEKYHPGARHLQGKNAAFFTPPRVADVVARNIGTEGKRILDLGAGIGTLPFAIVHYSHWEPPKEIVCIELNPEYVEVGKRLVPSATWICGDMFDLALLRSLDRFDVAISNPPYGRGTSGLADKSWLSVTSCLHMQAVEVALRMTGGAATFVLPQVDLPWRFSMYPRDWDMAKRIRTARTGHAYTPPEQYSQNLRRILKVFPDIYFGSTSEDIGDFGTDWKGVAPAVEVVSIGFDPPDYSHRLPPV